MLRLPSGTRDHESLLMAPPLLTLSDIHLNFGTTPLFEGVNMTIYPHERLCLVGRNGSGKSTLMKMAAGLIEPDAGTSFLKPKTTIRYLVQEPDLSGFATLMDYIEDGLVGVEDRAQIYYYLDALGLSGELDPAPLSGGEKRRAAIIRALAANPDILFLDEPTNHLDLPAIGWLEGELSRFRGALVMISHDRRFLQNLSQKTLWLDRGQSQLLEKGFSHFESWRDEYLEQEALDHHKLSRQIAREQHWIVHGVSGRRKRNMRRVKELKALRESYSSHRGPQGRADVTIAKAARSGKHVLRAEHVSKSFDGRVLIKDFSLKLARGERLGIVGPNGSGKTTLLKILLGQTPADAGDIETGVGLETLILEQTRESLDPDMGLADALTDGRGDRVIIGDTQKHVARYMKDYLFAPEQARTPLRALSGGERARVQLARAMRRPSNLWVLDEPTNDLDMETLDLLQEKIADYEGTVILISHDRDFLDRTVTRLIAYEGEGHWQIYAGGYSDMQVQKAGQDGTKPRANSQANSQAKSQAKIMPAATGQATPPKPAKKLSYKYQYRLETLPVEIEKIEAEIKACETRLAEPDLFSKNPEDFAKIAKALETARAHLDTLETEWLELEALKEGLQS